MNAAGRPLPPHVRFRLWKLSVAGLTLLCTAWFATLGPIAAIVALMTAKHVLVALLLAQPAARGPDGGPDAGEPPRSNDGRPGRARRRPGAVAHE